MDDWKPYFDWTLAIEINLDGLIRVVATLFALAGINSCMPVVENLPRGLRRRIMQILRPAEYAARRLIVIAALRLEVKAPPLRETRALSNPATAASGGTDAAKPDAARDDGTLISEGAARIPPFQLFDPIPNYRPPFLSDAEIAALDDPHRNDRFLGLDDLPPDEPVPAKGLCLRINALRHALEELDAHALRLARWRANRSERKRPRRWSPLLWGRPPGWKKHPQSPVEELVKDCYTLALDAWRNTS